MCSMISSQCDELRKTADELDERAKAYAPTGRNVLSPMLRTAADTIWELSCKLAEMVDQREEVERLKAENAKLRKYANYYMESVANGGCEFCPYEEDLCDVETYPMYDGCKLYEEMRELGIGRQ